MTSKVIGRSIIITIFRITDDYPTPPAIIGSRNGHHLTGHQRPTFGISATSKSRHITETNHHDFTTTVPIYVALSMIKFLYIIFFTLSFLVTSPKTSIKTLVKLPRRIEYFSPSYLGIRSHKGLHRRYIAIFRNSYLVSSSFLIVSDVPDVTAVTVGPDIYISLLLSTTVGHLRPSSATFGYLRLPFWCYY